MGITSRFREAADKADKALEPDMDRGVASLIASLPDAAVEAERLIDIGSRIREVGFSIRDEIVKVRRASA